MATPQRKSRATSAANDSESNDLPGTVLARLRPYNKGAGLTMRTYTYRGVKFSAERGWYRVSEDVAARLREVKGGGDYSPLAFDVVATQAEAEEIERRELSAGRGDPSRPIGTFGAQDTTGTVARTNAQLAAGERAISATRMAGHGADPRVAPGRPGAARSMS